MLRSSLRSCWPAGVSASRRLVSTLGPSKSRDRLSVLGRGHLTKQDVLNALASEKPLAEKDRNLPHHSTNAAAILVSKDLSRWLDDSDFMSALLQMLRLGENGAPEQDLSLLTAAVDSLSPQSLHGPPSSGLSILRGDEAAILPGLWNQDSEPAASSFTRHPEDSRPSISMQINPFLGDSRPLDVTLPLANTVFENTRPFTLLATKWRRGGSPGSPPKLINALEKETQQVVASFTSIQAHANISVPVFPLTAPRRIASGLGNIVRQVEVDGVSVPASEELETAMHALIDARARLLPDAGPTSNRTWALVVPENCASLDFLRSLPTSVDDSGVKAEHQRAETFARHFSSILAEGGRLHRVLSGGGGWGAKRGLLSLDPQSTYSAPGARDLENFIASFGGEATPDSVVTPGSYIQFLVEPVQPSSSNAVQQLPSLLVGTTSSSLADSSSEASTSRPPSLIEGHFGALSNSGFYLGLGPGNFGGKQFGQVYTKVDAGNSYVWEGSSRWV